MYVVMHSCERRNSCFLNDDEVLYIMLLNVCSVNFGIDRRSSGTFGVCRGHAGLIVGCRKSTNKIVAFSRKTVHWAILPVGNNFVGCKRKSTIISICPAIEIKLINQTRSCIIYLTFCKHYIQSNSYINITAKGPFVH